MGRPPAGGAVVRPVRIERPRLAERIASALETGSVLVVAGAGFGKTTAVDDAIRLQGRPAAWLSCTERDRDPGRLLVAVLVALRQVVPGVAEAMLERLEDGGRVDVLGAERWLLMELDALLVDPVTLVIDDAERLADAPPAEAVVAALLEGPIARLGVVVASRTSLALPLAKARAAGRITEFDEADLAFTADECAALLRSGLGYDPPASMVDERMAATLGWPLGLTVGAASPEQLGCYLRDEVLDRMDEGWRRAVLDAAVVEAITPGVAAALGLPAGFAERVRRAGLPLAPAAGRSDALAFHPLVREHLRAALESERTECERSAVLGRVAAALLDEGRTLEAVDAYLAAGRWNEALAAVLSTLPLALVTSPETVRGWLTRLPAAARRQPVARLLAGRLAHATGDLATAAAELRAAVAGLRGGGRAEAEWAGRLVLAESLYWLGELDELGSVADGWDAVDAAVDPRLPAAVALWSAQGLAGAGAIDRSSRLVDQVVARSPADEHLAALAGFHEFFVAAPSGDSDRCLQRFEEVHRRRSSGPHFLRHELIVSLMAFLFADQGRPAQGLDVTDWIVDDPAALTARPFVQPLTRVLRAWLAALAGDITSAERELARAPEPVPGRWPPSVAWTARAHVALAAGDRAAAAECARRAIAASCTAPVAFRSIFTLAAVPVLAAAGARQGAAEALEDALLDLDAALPGRAGAYHRARLTAQRAWLRHEGGEPERAAHEFAGALTEAGDAAPHMLRADWPRVHALLGEALERGLLEPQAAIDAVQLAMPGDDALLQLGTHPRAEVRARVAAALAGSGHPGAPARLKALAGDADPAVAAAARAATGKARLEPPPRTFRLLGGFAMQRGAWVVDDKAWVRPTVQRLVRFLLVHRGELLTEAAILDALWPGQHGPSARSALQTAVSRARAVLDSPGAERSAIELVKSGYRLVLAERDRVDVDAFEAAATDALAERGAARRTLLERAAAAWTGEPLPEDRDAAWSQPWRERLIRRHLDVLNALLELYLAEGDGAAAVDVAHRSLEVEPLDERVHRLLMVAYARTGRRGHALRQFLECRRVLVDRLGIEPDDATLDVHRRILAGESL